MSNEIKEKSEIFKKMTASGVKSQNQSTESFVGNGSVDFPSIDSNCFIDSASVDTASLDNNCFQDSLSVGNSSINVSMDLQDGSESTLDLQEITQSILDLEGTQTSRHSTEYGTSTELQGITQVPSSPPPSYEHVLAETRLAQEAAHGETTSDSLNAVPEILANVPPEPKKGIEIMHKSHKEFYKAVAKQWGITCKMSDHCRCLDCQRFTVLLHWSIIPVGNSDEVFCSQGSGSGLATRYSVFQKIQAEGDQFMYEEIKAP